jgi:C4-dicarboxylate transporter, DctM subunit
MMVATIPVIFPLVVHAGIDPVWYGNFLVFMMEMALVTPPVGKNLYLVQSVRGEGSIHEVIAGVMPFLLAMVAFILIISLFPGLAS